MWDAPNNASPNRSYPDRGWPLLLIEIARLLQYTSVRIITRMNIATVAAIARMTGILTIVTRLTGTPEIETRLSGATEIDTRLTYTEAEITELEL